MNKKRFAIAIAGAALGLATAAPAQAAYTLFFGDDANASNTVPLAAFPTATAARTAFLSNLAGVSTENLEAQSGGAPIALTFPGAGTATLTGAGGLLNVAPGTTNGFGRYATSGSRFWEASAGPTSSVSVDLGPGLAAFGCFGIDIGDFDGQLSLRLHSSNEPS